MSARMEVESLPWESLEAINPNEIRKLTEIQVECLFRNFDQQNLVAPLREVHAALTRAERPQADAESKGREALALQDHWQSCLSQREQLRSELKRGKEFLEQVQRELTRLRACIEDWPAYERVCGKNPLPEYIQSLTANERIEQFLPSWLERRERQLVALDREMEHCARQNGVEHLL